MFSMTGKSKKTHKSKVHFSITERIFLRIFNAISAFLCAFFEHFLGSPSAFFPGPFSQQFQDWVPLSPHSMFMQGSDCILFVSKIRLKSTSPPPLFLVT
jgi:hypothetical protein